MLNHFDVQFQTVSNPWNCLLSSTIFVFQVWVCLHYFILLLNLKLKQQLDVDRLYHLEYFDFERKSGSGVSFISCKIRG